MIDYFGYGSNMDQRALRAKGVTPLSSRPARLVGWRLCFGVAHFFRHEGGVGNIRHTGDPADAVHGILHRCADADLAALDRLEALGVGYDRVAVTVQTQAGPARAFAYVGLPAYVEEGLLPSRRYLRILLRGAEAAGLDPAYVAALRDHPVLPEPELPPFAPAADRLWAYDDLGPLMTVLGGHVFDMTGARAAHQIAKGWFARREVSVFLLHRHDASTGSETLGDVLAGRLDPAQGRYLNTYLHAFAEEYAHQGRFDYATLPPAAQMT